MKKIIILSALLASGVAFAAPPVDTNAGTTRMAPQVNSTTLGTNKQGQDVGMKPRVAQSPEVYKKAQPMTYSPVVYSNATLRNFEMRNMARQYAPN